MLFSLVPLLEVRHVKPSLLLRQDMPAAGGHRLAEMGRDGRRGGGARGRRGVAGGLARVGLMLSGGFVAIAFVLHLAGAALVRAVQPLRLREVVRAAAGGAAHRAARQPDARHPAGRRPRRVLHPRRPRRCRQPAAATSPSRPGPKRRTCSSSTSSRSQRDRLAAFLDAANGDRVAPPRSSRRCAPASSPSGASEMDLDSYEAGARPRAGARVHRHLSVAARGERGAHRGRVVGSTGRSQGEAEVSIEERFSDRDTDGNFRLGSRIQVGDQMRFDVLGRIITARVTSVRRVDWQDFRAGGFMFVFRPGTFDGAPHTFISALQGPREPGRARRACRASLVSQFPNVSVIDLREILQTVQALVNNVTLAVTVVGALVLLSGGLILVGAVSMTKFRRVYEAAILKTLGASSRLIARCSCSSTACSARSPAPSARWAPSSSAGPSPATRWISRGKPRPASPSSALSPRRVIVAAIGVLASLDVLGTSRLRPCAPSKLRSEVLES